jgi:hypothetical protein
MKSIILILCIVLFACEKKQLPVEQVKCDMYLVSFANGDREEMELCNPSMFTGNLYSNPTGEFMAQKQVASGVRYYKKAE